MSDDRVAEAGTINLDAAEVSNEFTLEESMNGPFTEFVLSVLRLFAPLM